MTVERVEDRIAKRTGFNEIEEIVKTGDVGVPMAVAMARSEVESRYIMAERHPRNWAKVEQLLLLECQDPDFARDKSALYEKPVGGDKITGLGARFAEAAMRCSTNMLAQAPIVYEDDKQIHRRVSVTDLESNSTRMYDVRITKTVERKTVAPDDKHTILSSRTNSEGETTFTVAASEDAMYNKDNSAVSKAWRNGVLALMPKQILKRCEKAIIDARTKEATDHPDAARRNIVDSFYSVGVSVDMLEEYLDHPVETCTPSEVVNLQGIYSGLATGEIRNWRDVMDNIEEMRKKKGKKPEPEAGVKGGGADARGVAAAEAKLAAEEAAKKKAGAEEDAKKKATQEDKKKPAEAKPAPEKKDEKKAPAAPPKKAEAKADTKAPAKTEAKAAPPKEAAKPNEEPAKVEAPAETATPAPTEAVEDTGEGGEAPPWATEVEPEPAEAAPAEKPAPEKKAPAPTTKRLEIRKVLFPEVLVKIGDDEPPPDQVARVQAECDRLGVSLDKTIGDWTETVGPRLTADDINVDTMECVYTVLSAYKKNK